MAKFGGKEDAGYDPFSQISNSLNALKQGSQPSDTEPELDHENGQNQAAAESETPAASRAAQRIQEPKPEPRPRQDTSNGGGGGVSRAGSQIAQTPVSPEVALRVTKRFKTSHEEGLRLDQAALRLAAQMGTNVDMSKITRALWDVYLRHEEEILRSIPADQPTRRPANNDAVGLAELDERLADLIGEGLMMACMRQRRPGR
ncbi:MAG: hypothetical protein ACIAS6_01160 [Phycisphaerales bacterium JB060]